MNAQHSMPDPASVDGKEYEPSAPDRITGSWEVDALLSELALRRYTFYYFGVRDQPDSLAAVKQYAFLADVMVLWAEDRAASWRTPLFEEVEPEEVEPFAEPQPDPVFEKIDPLNPKTVLTHYLGIAKHTLRALLTLGPEDELLPSPYPAPPECRVPESERLPYTVRPPQ